MQPKNFPIERVETIASEIAAAPALPPKRLTQDQVLRRLAKVIKTLHDKKNYSPAEIVTLLKKTGVKTTVREVKNIIEKPARKTPQKKAEKVV
jgi:hypothetical protein